MLMLISCSCIVIASCYFLSWLSIFAFKFNRIKLNLNNCWLSHGAAESSFSQCNHICLYGKAFIRSVVMPLVGASNEGRLWACVTLAQ